MALAETAQLAVELNLGGNFTAGMAAADKSLMSFTSTAEASGASSARVTSSFSAIQRAATGVGGAFSHAGSQLKGLLMGPLGLIGLGTAAFGVGDALEHGISKAETWGLQIEKLTGITGDSAETLSGLLAVTEKYGLSNERLSQIAGFTEKKLGALAANTAALDKFTTNYGFSIETTGGKVKDFNTLLLTFSDYWNSNADQGAKAAAAATLFGRGYADLVPILNLGSKGIKDAADEAAALGLTLTSVNVNDLAKLREGTRQLGDAMGGLELQIGLALIPTIKDFAAAATGFISQHRDDIVNFFRNTANFARDAAHTIGDVVGTISGFWNSIPPEMRDILVKGFIADKTVKFLFGFDPAGAAIDTIKTAITSAMASGIAKGAVSAGIGKLFVQPVFVTNPGFGSGGNLLGDLAGGAAGVEGAGAVGAAAAGAGTLLAIGGGLLAAALAPYLIAALLPRNPSNFTPNQTSQKYATSRPSFGAQNVVVPTSGGTSLEDRDARDRMMIDMAATQATKDLDQSVRYASSVFADAPWLSKLEASWQKAGQTIHESVRGALADLASGKNTSAAAAFLGTHLGTGGFGSFGYAAATKVLGELRALGSGDPAVAQAIRELEARLPRLKTDAVDLAKAEQIAQSTDPKNAKLDQLSRIMADLRAHGDPTTQKKVGDLIAAVKAQKFTVTTNVTVPITVDGSSAGSTVRRVVSRTGGSLTALNPYQKVEG